MWWTNIYVWWIWVFNLVHVPSANTEQRGMDYSEFQDLWELLIKFKQQTCYLSHMEVQHVRIGRFWLVVLASCPAVRVDILLVSDRQDVSWFPHFFASSYTDVSAATSSPIHSNWSNTGPLTKPISTVYPEPLPPLCRVHSQAAAGKCLLSDVQEAPSVVLQPNLFIFLILFWHRHWHGGRSSCCTEPAEPAEPGGRLYGWESCCCQVYCDQPALLAPPVTSSDQMLSQSVRCLDLGRISTAGPQTALHIKSHIT